MTSSASSTFALTRARHQLVVWWAHTRGVEKGPLGRLLFGDPADPEADVATPSDDSTRKRFADLAAELGDGFSVVELAPADPEPRPAPVVDAPDPDDLACAVLGRAEAADRSFYRWSFSTLTKKEVARQAAVEPDPRGGFDEDTDPDGDDTPTGPPGAGTAVGALADLPAGKEFGIFLHAVLEQVDFTVDAIHDEIHDVMARTSPGPEAIGINPDGLDALVDGLVAVVETPLDGVLDGHPLRRTAPNDRLAELQFHFGLPHRDAVTARSLFSVAGGDPEFGDYFTELADRSSDAPVRGLMTGSIDAVLRCPTADGTQFAVVDYKSNRLHAPGAPPPDGAYDRAAMHRAMVEHEYPAQALLYLVALHRFLNLRLPGYDIDRDLGPAAYLFARGMVGPGTPVRHGTRDGVFVWRPDSAVILAASGILEVAE